MLYDENNEIKIPEELQLDEFKKLLEDEQQYIHILNETICILDKYIRDKSIDRELLIKLSRATLNSTNEKLVLLISNYGSSC
jgi:hypothetical protein